LKLEERGDPKAVPFMMISTKKMRKRMMQTAAKTPLKISLIIRRQTSILTVICFFMLVK